MLTLLLSVTSYSEEVWTIFDTLKNIALIHYMNNIMLDEQEVANPAAGLVR